MDTTKMINLLWQGTRKQMAKWQILHISEIGNGKEEGWLEGFKVMIRDFELRFLLRIPNDIEVERKGCHKMAFALEVASPHGLNTVTTDNRIIRGQPEPLNGILLFTYLIIRRSWMYHNDPVRFALEYTNLGELSMYVPYDWDIGQLRASLYGIA